MSFSLQGRTVLVAGLGVSGAAAARVLLDRGARVLLTDATQPSVVAELAGWTEQTVIVRFWLVTAMAVAFGLGLFYADWLSFAWL